MPEKPTFDPNKPFKEISTEIINKPKFDPSKPFKSIDNNPIDTHKAYLDALNGVNSIAEPIQKKQKTDEIISNIPDISENEKQVVKNLANKGASTEEISNSILTLQGKHPAQFGHKGYYMKDDNGVIKPQPLAYGQVPKDEKLAATVFSEKTLPEELNSSFERGAIKLAGGILRTPEFLFDAAMEENFNKHMKVIKRPDLAINSTKIADELGIHNEPAKFIEKNLEKRDADFNNVYDKGITEYLGNGEYKKAAGLLANSIAESAPTTIALALTGGGTAAVLGGGTVFAAQKKAELDKEAPDMSEDKKIAIATTNGLLEGIFEQWGITKLGGIAKDIFAKEGKDAAKKFIGDAFKETYKPTVGKYLGVVGEETLGEMATQFSQNAVDKFSGYKPDIDLMDGVIDAGIVGLGASAGPSIVMHSAEKSKIEKSNEQSRYIFNKIKQGPEAVTAFKAEMDNAQANGLVTKEEADKAKFQADVYSDYHEQTADLKLDDEKKREIYDYTYQKSNLIEKIKAVDKDKLNGIELAKYHGLEKQAKDLQHNIDEIVLNAQIKDADTLAEKTIDEQIKGEQKPANEEKKPKLTEEQQARKDKYKKLPEPEVGKYDNVKYEDIPLADFNSEKFNARVKHAKLADYLENIPDKKLAGKLVEKKYVYNNKQNSTYAVQLPDGKIIKLASSMERPEKFRGHMRTEHLIDAKDLVGFPVGVKLEYLPEGKKVIKLYNGKTGKFISWAKETNRGLAKPSDLQVEQLAHLETVKEPSISGDETNSSQKPVQPNPNLTVQTNNENTEKSTVNTTESTKGNNIQPIEDDIKKTKALVAGTKKSQRKIKDPKYLKALSHEVFTPHELAMQYFIGKGLVNPKSIQKLFKGSQKEVGARLSYTKNDAPTIEQIGEKIVNDNESLNLDLGDVINAVEDIVTAHNTPSSMATMLNSAYNIEEQDFSESERELSEGAEMAEEAGIGDEFNNVIDIIEGLSDEEISALTQESLNRIIDENESDIFVDNGEGDQFQKTDLLKINPNELNKYDSGQLKKLISQLETGMSDVLKNEGVEKANRLNDLIGDIIDVYNSKLIEEKNQSQKQKGGKGNVEAEHHEKVLKVIAAMQKALPNIEFKYNKKLKAAGVLRASGKTIEINPYYAGLDTPIHEAGHVLIDAMGYDNKVIQEAFKQLKNTKLADETKQRYPELSEEMLNKEILAEAIGREGAGIFDTEAEKSRFKQLLDYIFTWFKNKLGLNKNVAKSLAKQIIAGVGTKDIGGTENNTDQEQKPKSADDFNKFREKQLGRNISDEEKDLNEIEEDISKETDEDVIADLEDTKQDILDIRKADEEAYDNYLNGKQSIKKLADVKSLKDYTLEDLIENYNLIKDTEGYEGDENLTKAKERIAYYVNEKRKEQVEKKHKGYIEANANKKDLSPKDLWMKTLGHIGANFPGVQGLYQEFNEKYLAMQQERNTLKAKNQKLAKAVISEYNEKHGVPKRIASWFSSNSAKYFNYLEQDGKLRTDTKGLSKAQIDYLNFQKELVEKRGKIEDENGELAENELFKVDKGFQEARKDEGILRAMSNYMGGGNNLDVMVKNPITGKESTYQEAQKDVINDANKKGVTDKAKALGSLLRLAYKAKANSEQTAYGMNYSGQLTSKFDEPYEGDTYSKDFYAASMKFIDDYTHVKQMNKVVPIFDAILDFYKKLELPSGKPPTNIIKFIENEMNDKIYQKDVVTGGPISDLVLKKIRGLVSKTVMAFNVKANLMNAIIGNYSAWREEGLKHWAIGNARLFSGNHKFNGESGYGAINEKAAILTKEFNVLGLDVDSTPELKANKLFAKLAYGANKLAEYQVQASQFLGHLTDKEWNSFDVKDGKFHLKEGVNKKEFDTKMNEYKDKVSDVQGKYSDKDRRNFMRGEIGKNIASYKVWIPDWYKMRFGKEAINANDEMVRGSWNIFTDAAMKEIAADFNLDNNYNGILKAGKGVSNIFSNKAKNKQIIRNVRGMAAIAGITILSRLMDDDDDKEKKFETLSLENALGNILFIFDPDADIYLLEHPVAVSGPLISFFKALSAAKKGDEKRFKKNAIKLIPYRHILDVVPEKK